MLNNSLVIGLAIISLVCVYLIWEHFKMSAKLKYLEMSIHETVQTVQGLVNNNLCLPPRQEMQHHPPQYQQSQQHQQSQQSQQPQQPQQSQQSQQPQQPQQPQQSQQPQQPQQKDNIDISKLAGGLFQSGGGVFQNILTNLMASFDVKDDNNQVENEEECEFEEYEDEEDVDDENVDDDVEDENNMNQNKESVEIEPLEITDELKEQINNLTFTEPENEPLKSEPEPEFEIEELEEVKDSNDNVEELNEIEPVELSEKEPVQIQDFDAISDIEELGEIKFDNMVGIDINTDMKIYSEMESEQQEEQFDITNSTQLNNMTLKQLQDIADKYKIGKRGTKEQIVARIKRHNKMTA